MNEKIINARVSSDLYDKLVEKARKHRTTVSKLIRDMMEDSLEMYDEFATSLEDKIGKEIKSESKNDIKNKEIAGYQPFISVKAKECVKCHKSVAAGDKSFLAVFADGKVAIEITCTDCAK